MNRTQSGAPCLGCASDQQPVSNGIATVNAFMTAVLLYAIDPKQVAIYLAALCPRHAAIGVEVLGVMAKKNRFAEADLTERLRGAFGMTPRITCPRCGATSFNENDVRAGYCGRCHDWTGADPRCPS
jgi:hypothetical protein